MERQLPGRLSAALSVGLLLTGCGGGAAAGNADDLTAAEQRQLDEAAQRLDSQRESRQAEMAAQARADAAAAQAENQSDSETR